MKKTALILDYGMGNIDSISNLLNKFKINHKLGNSPDELLATDLLILPGVGAFGPAMRNINQLGLRARIIQRHLESRPILGICLGFQILSRSSEEAKNIVGLSLFDLETRKIHPRPVIGWQETSVDLFPLRLNRYFFYNHSYGVFERDIHLNNLGNKQSELCLYKINNTVGVQFHPEKSQNAGLEFFGELLEGFWSPDA
jgi:glutamine amidotransferase